MNQLYTSSRARAPSRERTLAMNEDTRAWATHGRRSFWSAHGHRVVAVAIAVVLALGAWYAYENSDELLALGSRDVLGPANGSWYSSFPEDHGLRGHALIEGSTQLKLDLPARDCVVVVKDGVVVHEEYYNGATLNSVFNVGYVGKVATALAIGAAILRQDLTLDDKVKELLDRAQQFGGDTPPEWNSEYWASLTVRELLAQVSSDGSHVPGEEFRNDAAYNDVQKSPLKYLNGVLRGATGQRPTAFAKKRIADPLGLGDFFEQGTGSSKGEMSFVGGQLASCRDMARFGQLIVNEGRWKMPDGGSRQLVDKKFLRAMMRPSYPDASRYFGLAGWTYNVHAASKMNDQEQAQAGNESAPTNSVSGLGADCPVHDGPVLPGAEPSYDVLFNAGEMGSMMITVPEQRTVVVSLGTTWGSSPTCPAVSAAIQQADLAESERTVLPRNDMFAVQRAWQIIAHAIDSKPSSDQNHRLTYRKLSRSGTSYENVWASLHHKNEPLKERKVVLPRLGDSDQNAYNDQMETLVNSVPDDQVAASKVQTASITHDATWTEDDPERFSGTCSCSCAPNLEIGQCFNVRNSRSRSCDDLNLRSHGTQFCPELGIVNSCGDANTVTAAQYGTSDKYSSQNVSDMIADDHGGLTLTNKQLNPASQSAHDVENSVFTCSVTQGCGEDAPGHFWNHKEGKHGDGVYALRCAPTGFSVCTFTPDAECAFNPQVPLTNVSIAQGENEVLVEMPTEGWILQSEQTGDDSDGDLGEDLSYVRLQIPGRRVEEVQLIAVDEGKYVAFNAVFGATAIAFGVVLVAIAKGKFTSNDEDSEPLVSGGPTVAKYDESV